ncbi:preprotein translocase subunit SecG [Moheibacter sediminis]|uniref:Protein-export membrane protein SecG n=1 Tax=Moheibacter sediminis TaxID=1434700 RepID=A0A1W1ZT59_9FLAO|nr:preprotein translocase subunit SecG [Moheibacter sediminis]SMC51442.1 preprotein translocase subunit SecG [Moheibacter sediminis]
MGTFTFLMVLIIVVCVLIILVILSQNPKGGGLSSTFGGSGGGQMFGVQRTNEFLDKATWTLATIIVVLIITANVLQENPYASTVPVNEVPVELPQQQSAPTPDAPATPTNTPPAN